MPTLAIFIPELLPNRESLKFPISSLSIRPFRQYSPKTGFALWGLLWPEQYFRTEYLRMFANFQLASPEQSRAISCIPGAGGSYHMLT